jgi:hypothetical protein
VAKRTLALLFAGLAGVLIYLAAGRGRAPSSPETLTSMDGSTASTLSEPESNTPSRRTATSPGAAEPAPTGIPVQAPPPGLDAAAVSESPTTLSTEAHPQTQTLPPATVLENLRTVFRGYAAMFGENPVGTNEEITRALKGDNPKQANFLTATEPPLNAKGELLDPWGTPYFFHQLSGQEMEIRSAGPDQKLWTADDLVTR